MASGTGAGEWGAWSVGVGQNMASWLNQSEPLLVAELWSVSPGHRCQSQMGFTARMTDTKGWQAARNSEQEIGTSGVT